MSSSATRPQLDSIVLHVPGTREEAKKEQLPHGLGAHKAEYRKQPRGQESAVNKETQRVLSQISSMQTPHASTNFGDLPHLRPSRKS